MPNIDVTTAFPTQSYILIDYFSRPGAAFYIPLYQREYSWDEDNVKQLVGDIFRGVTSLLDTSTKDTEIRFLGTIITVRENNPNANIDPRDPRAFPTRIDIVIDGQQRLSTITLLATVLFEKISKYARLCQ